MLLWWFGGLADTAGVDTPPPQSPSSSASSAPFPVSGVDTPVMASPSSSKCTLNRHFCFGFSFCFQIARLTILFCVSGFGNIWKKKKSEHVFNRMTDVLPGALGCRQGSLTVQLELAQCPQGAVRKPGRVSGSVSIAVGARYLGGWWGFCNESEELDCEGVWPDGV